MAEAFVKNPGKVLKEIFVRDKFFLQKSSTRLFWLAGIAANLLSALVVFFILFPSNVVLALFGGVLSITFLWRCVVSVKQPIAIAFGVGVALWWGIVAMTITQRNPTLAFLSFLLTLIVSSAIHIWYINNRLKR